MTGTLTSFTHDSRSLAETYDRVSDLQFEGGKGLVERLGLEEGARVLDVGCGTGRLAHWIAERVGIMGAVTGIKAKALAEVRRVLRPGGRLGGTTLPQELSRAGTV